MAMIENIRKRRGLLIFFIGIGMLGFLVPYDAVMSLFGSAPGSESIGEIDGKVIDQAGFQKNLLAVQQSNLYRGDDQISNAAWADLVNETLYGDDLDAAGYVVGEEEYDDVRFGVSPSAMVKQAYYGGTVTEESRDRARNLFETQLPTAERAQKQMIVKRYKLEKLESLLKKGIYANSLDAERDYLMKNDKVAVSFAAVKYTDISDSTVTVSDSEVMSFFNKNKMNPKYQQNPFRELKLLTYDVLPSAQDSIKLRNEIALLKEGFISATDDSVYVVQKSNDRVFNKEIYQAGTTAGATDGRLVNGNVGDVVGPYEDNGAYKLSKIIEKKPIVTKVTGRHIFLAAGFRQAERDSVIAIADSLKTLLDDGASFSTLAAKWSADDSTATKGGSLGWLSADDTVNPDEKVKNQLRTVLMASEKGKVNVAQVPGGLSLYEATNFEYNGVNSVLAVIASAIVPSDDTQNELYSEVSSFALQFSSGVNLVSSADEEGLTAATQKVTRATRIIPNIPNSEEVVRWANSRDISLNDVSKVFEIDNKYVVATVSKIQDERTPEYSTVADDIRADALKEAKFKYVKAAMSKGSLDDIVASVEGATKKTANLSMNSNNLNGLGGNEPEAVGLAFGSPADVITRAVKGQDGAVVVQVSEKTLAPEKASYSAEQATLQSSFANKYNLIKSSLTKAAVSDDRNR